MPSFHQALPCCFFQAEHQWVLSEGVEQDPKARSRAASGKRAVTVVADTE